VDVLAVEALEHAASLCNVVRAKAISYNTPELDYGKPRAVPREYPNLPLVGVGAVVVREGRVLLIRRAKPPRQGEWSLPGGLQKLGETVFEAARREVLEETGVVIRPLAVIDVVDLIEGNREGRRVRYHYTLIDVVAAWVAGEAVAAGDAMDVLWAERAAVGRLVGWSETVRIVERAYRMLAGDPAYPGT
jgi:ADP-ribose pyrophosphatase YjhB (NUDIX family)